MALFGRKARKPKLEPVSAERWGTARGKIASQRALASLAEIEREPFFSADEGNKARSEFVTILHRTTDPMLAYNQPELITILSAMRRNMGKEEMHSYIQKHINDSRRKTWERLLEEAEKKHEFEKSRGRKFTHTVAAQFMEHMGEEEEMEKFFKKIDEKKKNKH